MVPIVFICLGSDPGFVKKMGCTTTILSIRTYDSLQGSVGNFLIDMGFQICNSL